MSTIRRIYRRVTTTERISVPSKDTLNGPSVGDTFRVEIILKNGTEEKLVYEREHTGSVEVEELDGGKFVLTGEVVPSKVLPGV